MRAIIAAVSLHIKVCYEAEKKEDERNRKCWIIHFFPTVASSSNAIYAISTLINFLNDTAPFG